jgi:hypothetical protein
MHLSCRGLSADARPNCRTPDRAQIEELTLKCAGATQLRLLFGEPMLAQTSHVRLRGDVPADREMGKLTPLAGGRAGGRGGGVAPPFHVSVALAQQAARATPSFSGIGFTNTRRWTAGRLTLLHPATPPPWPRRTHLT